VSHRLIRREEELWIWFAFPRPRQSFPLVYSAIPDISELVPSKGSDVGGYQITAKGFNFENSDGLVCKFGCCDISPATFFDFSRVLCATSLSSAGQQAVEVSNDGVAFSKAGTMFEFQHDGIVFGVSPDPVWLGESSILTVIGLHFSETISFCRFSGFADAVASVASSSLIRCRVPHMPPGKISIQLLNGDNSTVNGGAFADLQQSSSILNILPTAIGTTGGQIISVFGSGFPSKSLLSVWC
jgi:hypothetical protein